MKKMFAALLGSVMLLNGTALPRPAAAQALTDDTRQYYLDWKAAFLRKDPYVKTEDRYYVFYGEQTYEEAQETVPVTVSEAHGYGMLITAMMSDYVFRRNTGLKASRGMTGGASSRMIPRCRCLRPEASCWG